MSNLGIVNQYLEAFYAGDFDGAGALVAEDFQFKGPFIEVVGRAKYFLAAERLKPIMRGHVMLKQWEDGADICSLYEVNLQTPATSGKIYMSEWNRVLNEKLAVARLIFDTGAFRKLVPIPQP